MANDDLIRRADALRLLDENGVVFRREFEELPSVDAIPVKWLRDLQHRAMVGGYTELEGNIMMLLREWQQEIGARMDGDPDA